MMMTMMLTEHALQKEMGEEKSEMLDNASLVYGEIDFFSFASILEIVNPQPNEV